MHKLLFALLAAAVLAALVWLFFPGRAGEAPAASPRAPALPAADLDAELASPSAAAGSTEGVEARALAPEAQPAPEAASGPSLPRSRILGLVLDQRSAPIQGAEVVLQGRGRWVGEDVHPGDVPSSYAIATGPDGRFAFDVLTPTSDLITLTLTAGIQRGRGRRHFGLASGEDPLRVGDNDLGTFVLPDAGAVSGRVTDAHGAPLSGVEVSLHEVTVGGYTLSARTDERGLYELGGLPPVKSSFRASAAGYLDRVQSRVDVQNGQTTPGVDFALAAAPSISGRVVDEDGAPLAGVRLWGSPKSTGHGAGGRSAEDGSFVVHLAQDEPYTLGAKLSGYEELSGGRGSPLYAPGTRDLELVLKRPPLHTFRVQDAVTGAPVERFGMKLIQVRLPSGGFQALNAHDEPEALSDHPGGVVQLAGDPSLCDYVIDAPGYGSQRGPVALKEGEQVIALRPEAALLGRLVLDGAPVPEPAVRVKAGGRPINLFSPGQQGNPMDRRDLDPYAGRPRFERGGADGSFRVGGLAPGTYELVLSAAGMAPLKLERIKLRAGEVRDLGDLAAHAPGEIKGVVLLLAGMARGGLRVMFGDGLFADYETSQFTDDSGTFRFGGLPAGAHQLLVEEKRGVVLDGPPFPVELAAGESRHVVLDVAPRVPCRVSVRARLSGAALDGVRAVAVRRSGGKTSVELIGVLDAEGRAEGFLAAGEVQAFELRGPSEATLAADAGMRVLEAGGALELEFEAALGSLVAILPAPADGAAMAWIQASVRRTGGGDAGSGTGWVQPELVDGMLHVDLGALAPGTYDVQVWNGRGQPWTAAATIEAGIASTVELRSP